MPVKKNELATFVVYIGMLAIALLVALYVIRPVVARTGNAMHINYIALVILGLFSGLLLNTFILEGGHFLGAKTGKYKVYRWNFLGLTIEKDEVNNKKKVRFSAPLGLTGDTTVVPLDREKSSLSGYIFFPFLGIIIEVIFFMILVVNGKNLVGTATGYKGDLTKAWMIIFGQVNLAVTGMLVLYDIFPARLESMTDGFLLTLLTKQGNKLAYNDILVQEYDKYYKREPKPLPIYKEVTEFTYLINNISAMKLIAEGNYEEAIKIYDLAINVERGLSKTRKNEAICAKFTLNCLLNKAKLVKDTYEGFSDQTKAYITELTSLHAARTYLLISGLMEGSQDEAEYVLGKFDRLIRAQDKEYRPLEVTLIEKCLELIANVHPSWNLQFEYVEKEDKEKEEELEVEEEVEEVEETTEETTATTEEVTEEVIEEVVEEDGKK